MDRWGGQGTRVDKLGWTGGVDRVDRALGVWCLWPPSTSQPLSGTVPPSRLRPATQPVMPAGPTTCARETVKGISRHPFSFIQDYKDRHHPTPCLLGRTRTASTSLPLGASRQRRGVSAARSFARPHGGSMGLLVTILHGPARQSSNNGAMHACPLPGGLSRSRSVGD